MCKCTCKTTEKEMQQQQQQLQQQTGKRKEAQQQQQPKVRGMKCSNCEEYGHKSSDCDWPKWESKPDSKINKSCGFCVGPERYSMKDCKARKNLCNKCNLFGHYDSHYNKWTNVPKLKSWLIQAFSESSFNILSAPMPKMSGPPNENSCGSKGCPYSHP